MNKRAVRKVGFSIACTDLIVSQLTDNKTGTNTINAGQKKREPEGSRFFIALQADQRGNAGGFTPAISSITRTTWQL